MMNRLQIYTVHFKPGRQAEAPVFVREGFSLPAFLFTLLWALYYRLWIVVAGLLLFNVAVMALVEQGLLSEAGSFILLLAAQIMLGFHGNDLRRAALSRAGHITAAVVAGDSRARAELRYFDETARARGAA